MHVASEGIFFFCLTPRDACVSLQYQYRCAWILDRWLGTFDRARVVVELDSIKIVALVYASEALLIE